MAETADKEASIGTETRLTGQLREQDKTNYRSGGKGRKSGGKSEERRDRQKEGEEEALEIKGYEKEKKRTKGRKTDRQTAETKSHRIVTGGKGKKKNAEKEVERKEEDKKRKKSLKS